MRSSVLAIVLAASGASLRADFTYTQTAQMTGGALYTMMRSLGPLARGAREPMVTTNILKGNRMAVIGKDSITVTDLDKETITTINTAKKEYSVVTFAQMKQAMEDAMARAQGKGKNDTDLKFKVSARATGQTKTFNGLNAKEMMISMQAEATDAKSGQTGAMDINVDTWLAAVPGYDEVKAFHRRMGEKMGYLFGSGMQSIGAMQPQTMRGFAQVAEEMSKVDGVPVQQIMKMGGSAEGAAGQQPQAQPQQESQQPSSSAAAAAAAGAIGRLGGFGGFGRNRKNNNKSADQPAQSSEQPAGSGSLIEMTTELTSFSNAAADTSKFDVPAGFKQVENDLTKRRR